MPVASVVSALKRLPPAPSEPPGRPKPRESLWSQTNGISQCHQPARKHRTTNQRDNNSHRPGVDLCVSHPKLPRSRTVGYRDTDLCADRPSHLAVACCCVLGRAWPGWGWFCGDADYNTPGGLSEQAQAGPSVGAGPALPRPAPWRRAGTPVPGRGPPGIQRAARGPRDLHVHSNSAQDLRQPPPTARKYTPHRH